MTIIKTYLVSIQGKIFKLLPMREERAFGIDNHLTEYVTNICDNFDSEAECRPELSSLREIAEVQANLWFLRANIDCDFAKWRSVILRSVRLIQSVLERNYKE